MTDPVLLDAVMTRTGLNALITRPGNVKQMLTHVGLSPTAFTANADMTALPDEVQRWPIIDGIEVGDNQVAIYAEYPWTGADTAIRSLALYSGDTLIALRSSPHGEVECYLTRHTLQDAFWQIAFTAAPTNSVTVKNTGYRYNSGTLEALTKMATVQINEMTARLKCCCALGV